MTMQYNIEETFVPVARVDERAARLLHESVALQAARAPHHVAFEIDGRPLTYVELDARANQVANYLIGRGVSAGDFVAFYQERSADLFIAMLGAMKAGAAYIPVDPRAGGAHLDAVVAKWAPKMIVASKALSGDVAPAHAAALVVLEDEKAALRKLTSFGRFVGMAEIAADAPAHVMFTGRTADGLLVDHADAVRYTRSLVSVYGLEAHHLCFQDEGLALDVAIEEVWAMLSVGATVAFGAADAATLARNEISFLSTVPETLGSIDAELPALQIVVAGARRAGTDLAVKWSLKVKRFISLKLEGDRIPTFAIQQDAGAWRPRMLHVRAGERAETEI